MCSPRPSLTSSCSIISTSSSDGESPEEEEAVSIPQARAPPPTSSQTTVNVREIKVEKGAKVPGLVNGTINNTHINFFINRSGDAGNVAVDELVTDAVKVNADTFKSYLSPDFNSSSNKLIGTKEDVEGLSRRWCYLITSLVILSLITLLGTAVLSLTSWRTSQSSTLTPILTTTLNPDIQATIDGLSAEEKKFAAVEGSPAIVGRTEWVAQPSKWSVKNTLPVRRVVVSDTVTDPCGAPAECVETVRTMQMLDVEQHHQPDIRDNFLIGGNGEVYWGRGFASQGNYTDYNDGSIGVAFIGAFAKDGPTSVMMSTFHKLVAAGVRVGMIAGDYALLARCQLVSGASMGSALLQAMKTWPHFNHNSTGLYSCTAR